MSFTDFVCIEDKIFEVLFNYIILLVQFFQKLWVLFFKPNDFYVQKAYLEYIRNGEVDTEDITKEYRESGSKSIMSEKSTEITEFLFRVKYLYNSTSYMYVTRNPDHVFPPPKPKLSFRLPIKEVFLLDSDDVPMYNITDDIRMYEGPYSDFHGETVSFRDMQIDEEGCKKVRLVNIMGTTVEYSMTDSISHQTLWSPDKTLVPPDLQHCNEELKSDCPPLA
jgi:hypothetical protein